VFSTIKSPVAPRVGDLQGTEPATVKLDSGNTGRTPPQATVGIRQEDQRKKGSLNLNAEQGEL